MVTIAQYTNAFIAKWNGRKVSLDGEDINADGRYGIQCMDLWLKFRYGLGHTAWLPTPDAASVWELNSQPDHPMWQLWDAITPDRPLQLGDQFVMNRAFFGNGVGHIGTVIEDLGGSFRCLETNGLGDGYEDQWMNQYGSPARIHEWPKTYLYGALRWVAPVPNNATVNALVPAGEHINPIEEDTLSQAEVQQIKDYIDLKVNYIAADGQGGRNERGPLADTAERVTAILDTLTPGQSQVRHAGPVFGALAAIQGQNAGILEALKQVASKPGSPVDLEAVKAAAAQGVAEALDGARVTVQSKEA